MAHIDDRCAHLIVSQMHYIYVSNAPVAHFKYAFVGYIPYAMCQFYCPQHFNTHSVVYPTVNVYCHVSQTTTNNVYYYLSTNILLKHKMFDAH